MAPENILFYFKLSLRVKLVLKPDWDWSLVSPHKIGCKQNLLQCCRPLCVLKSSTERSDSITVIHTNGKNGINEFRICVVLY